VEQPRVGTAVGLHYAAPNGWGISVGLMNTGVSRKHELYVATGYGFVLGNRRSAGPKPRDLSSRRRAGSAPAPETGQAGDATAADGHQHQPASESGDKTGSR
jgi:hypothetical protein